MFSLDDLGTAHIHQPWLARGSATDGFWMEIPPFPFNRMVYTNVYVSTRGMLSFNRPKSSVNPEIGSRDKIADFLAPFRTSIGIVPQGNWNRLPNSTNSYFSSEITHSGTTRFTWHDVLLGREAEPPISFQVELFPNGDIIYRYDFTKIWDASNMLTNDFVIGYQAQGISTAILSQNNGLLEG